MKSTRGFTLLELLMVVIIIAILASIALPQYLRVSERSRASEALTVLGAMRAANLRFKAQDGALYTNNPANLDTDIPGFNGIAASKLFTYTITGTGAGSNVQAARTAGTFTGATISLDLDSGASCASNAVYGLTVGAC